MDKFILVSFDSGKKALKESVDLSGLVERATNISDVSSVFESLDVLSSNGYRVIVDPESTPFIYDPRNSINESIKELYEKFKDRFKNKDEFERAYEAVRAKKIKEGTWNVGNASPEQAPMQEQTPVTQSADAQIDKLRSNIPNLVTRIGIMFKADPEGYKMLLTQLQNKTN